MEDFQSKYSGEQVEAILDSVANGEAGGGGGGITIETDPVFSASPAASITEVKKAEWDAKYTKPSTGIPKSDLASAVQTSLGKADTALQSYTEQYKGTVTGVKINGTTKNPSSGVVDLGTVITSHQSLSNYYTKSEVDSKITLAITNAINASY
jgi:secreted PhoX family phosphatase